ncbi:MAG: hypothetical protein KGO48_00195 [Alphaproteobacteria bacterium]|nr:hypothetical protein [Alphaproteobacteria bacterium]
MPIIHMMLLAAIAAVLSAQTIYDFRSGAIRFWSVAIYRRTNPVVFRRIMAGRPMLVAAFIGVLLWLGVR